MNLGVVVQRRQQRNKQRAAQLYDHIVPVRVDGLKRASCVAVGEKHSIALQASAVSSEHRIV